MKSKMIYISIALVMFSFVSCLKTPDDGISGEPKKIFVNEISGNEKWLEIYNAENEAINLTGYTLQKIDDEGKVSDWSIPAGITIGGKGFIAWTQGDDKKETFTWGITAQRDVAFKLFDNSGRMLDHFEVKMENNLYSKGNNRTVGRQTDGHPNLIIFLNRGTKNGSNNNGTPDPSTPRK